MQAQAMRRNSTNWDEFETAQQRDVHQMFRHNGWEHERLARILRLAPGMTAVEAGCGGGYFAKILSRLVGESGKVLAFDLSEVLIRQGKEILARDKKLQNVELRVGDIYNIPLGNDCADLAASHVVLVNLSDPDRALREMCRIAKPGGIVIHFPNQRLTELFNKAEAAEYRCVQEEKAEAEGKFKMLAPSPLRTARLPEIFLACGLSHLRLDFDCTCFLACDERIPRGDLVHYYESRLAVLEAEERRQCGRLLKGGMAEQEVEEFVLLFRRFLQDSARGSPETLTELNFAADMIVSGKKGGKIELAEEAFDPGKERR